MDEPNEHELPDAIFVTATPYECVLDGKFIADVTSRVKFRPLNGRGGEYNPETGEIS